MKIKNTEISMVRGDSEEIIVSLRDTVGIFIPLVNGDLITMTIKKSTKSKINILQKKIVEFANGKAIIKILPEDTNLLSFGAYVYDIQLTKNDGTIKTIVGASRFIINEEVTTAEVGV